MTPARFLSENKNQRIVEKLYWGRSLSDYWQRACDFGREVFMTDANRNYSCNLAEFPSRARLAERIVKPNRSTEFRTSSWNWNTSFQPQQTPDFSVVTNPTDSSLNQSRNSGAPSSSTGSADSPASIDLDSAELERQLWHLFDTESLPDPQPPPSHPCARFGRICVDKLADENCSHHGYITEIGKFLLDPDAIEMFERIIKSGHTSKLISTLDGEHAAALLRLQSYLMKQQHVLSTIVIGLDGKIMSSSGARTTDLESLAAWAIAIYVNTKIATQSLSESKAKLEHILLTGPEGTVVLSPFGQALLLTVTSTYDADAIASIVQKLNALLA